jgi:hypothetical protein
MPASLSIEWVLNLLGEYAILITFVSISFASNKRKTTDQGIRLGYLGH